jgi:hypothetical protein
MGDSPQVMVVKGWVSDARARIEGVRALMPCCSNATEPEMESLELGYRPVHVGIQLSSMRRTNLE